MYAASLKPKCITPLWHCWSLEKLFNSPSPRLFVSPSFVIYCSFQQFTLCHAAARVVSGSLCQGTRGGLLSAELGLNHNLCQINRLWASTEQELALWSPVISAFSAWQCRGSCSLCLLTRWNSRGTCVWASLLAGSKLILSQKCFACHRNIICIEIWTLIFFFFPPCPCVFLLFIFPGFAVCHPCQNPVSSFFFSIGIWFSL